MTTPQTPRWYSVNNMGMATLCADQADAEKVASDCNIQWPRRATHWAVQLVEVSGCRLGRDEIVSMAREAGFAHSWSEAAGEALERFAAQATAKERTARIAAQVENEALKAERARSSLAHRKAVQEAVREAVREALQEAEEACGALRAPESCSGVERSLWDVATMACAEAVGKVGAT